MLLSEQELRHYEAFGFVIKRSLLTADEIETIRAEHHATLQHAQGHRIVDGGGSGEEQPRLWTRFQAVPQSVAPLCSSLMEDPRFLAPAEQAFGSHAIGLGVDANRYVAETGCALPLSPVLLPVLCRPLTQTDWVGGAGQGTTTTAPTARSTWRR